MLTDFLISEDRTLIKKDAEKILKYKGHTIENTCGMCKQNDNINNWGNWNYLKITHWHTKKAQNQGTTKTTYCALHTYFEKY